MNNTRIKILDCTLRDGGYVNNWDFGFENIKFIAGGLTNSLVDFIETGFLVDKKITQNQSLFNNIDEINEILPQNCDKNRYFAMISYGKFDIERLPKYSKNFISGIRFIFKKQNLTDALKACRQIKDKGYRLFINPTFINQYSETELIELIKAVNKIEPYGFSIVDSTGGLDEERILKIFNTADKFSNPNIAICLHSHDNLGLSFDNAKSLLESDTKRQLVIDSSISGIGRGAGNLKTDVIVKYLNDKFNYNYNLGPVQNIMEKIINPLKEEFVWGYSEANYLAGVNFCHPYYALFLSQKDNLPPEIINNILKNIPDNKKNVYDKDLIENLYYEHIKIHK